LGPKFKEKIYILIIFEEFNPLSTTGHHIGDPHDCFMADPQEIFVFVDFGQFCLFLAVPTKFRVIFHPVLGGFSPYNFRYVMGLVRYTIWFNKIFVK
jgi:hypothetical protein